jgi:putative endonuclease
MNMLDKRASADTVRFQENQEWHVYILRLSNNMLYTGCTSDMNDRLIRHQNGYVPATKCHRPVELLFYATFNDKYKAFAFEKYLKSGSGRAFINRHLI